MKQQFWIVVDDNGLAEKRHFYIEQEAHTHAMALSTKNPGQEFVVMQSQKTYFTENRIRSFDHGELQKTQG